MKKLLLSTALVALAISSYAQKEKLTWQDVRSWNRVTDRAISDQGAYIAVESKPWYGDGAVTLYSKNGDKIELFATSEGVNFLGEDYFVTTQKPEKALVDSLTLKKTKKDKMPQDKLIVFDIKKSTTSTIDSLKDVKFSKECSQWAAYRYGKANNLVVTNFDGKKEQFDNIESYQFADENGSIILNRYIKDSISQILIYDLDKNKIASTFDVADGEKCAKIAISNPTLASYIVKGEDLSGKDNKIYIFDGKKANELASALSLKDGWVVNETLTPSFPDSNERVLFGISPAYPVEDSTILASDKAGVDVWVWDEPKLKTMQVIDYDKDIKHPHSVVYDITAKKLEVLGDKERPYTSIQEDGNGNFALLESTEPYEMESMWTGRSKRDLYLKNIATGVEKELFKGVDGRVAFSPEGKYLYWYSAPDSCWNLYSIEQDKAIVAANSDKIKIYDESGNTPDLPRSYGSAFWSEDDAALYIYDTYDIWKLDPTASSEPQRLTDGYKTKTKYRVVNVDSDKKSYKAGDTVLLSLFDTDTKESGFANFELSKDGGLKSGTLKTLVRGEYRYTSPLKAKNSEDIIFTRENFTDFPDIYSSNIDFSSEAKRITELNPQQSNFNWGTVEPITWLSLNGDTLRGNLYKPADFDPSKKYPMICNFYERDSDGIYNHKIPEVHRSSIDYHYYTSNGYVIFNPDIIYTDGYPGESCYNSLMPGITKVLSMGFVDPKRIGAQGHSWGGYQVAYLATRTNIFAAIESGAPVVNMISAYGGIRWATGLNRAFQYEHGQSRIGASPWETPARYTENSPIYTMDKVNTPILIMHNDMDGHVPWWQGIEYFIALRRLEKPVWMLNYRGEPHWPLKSANQLDFQTKMSQFFDYYLKGTDMPSWMENNL
ncbi:MAG: prolyl oligopeptidase family serine peptidase [Rikenellaceae bacterium]